MNEPRQVAEEGASGGGRTELPPGTERSALFLIRSDALDAGLAEDLLRYIERRGFVVLDTFRIGRTDEVVATADRGEEGWIAAEDTPTFREGGLAVFAVDPDPLTPSPEQRKQHPAPEILASSERSFPLTAARIADARSGSARGTCWRFRTRGWSWAFATSLLGANVAELAAKIDTVTESYRTPQPVLHCFKRGRHTKVEMVEHEGRLAIRKTFRPGREQSLQQQLVAREYLSFLPAMPDLLDHGDNWILIPYYEDIVRHEPNTRSLLPLQFAKQILETVQQVHAAGYFCGDFSPGNIIIDRREGPKFIDLEFLYPYPGDPGPFEDSPSVQGMPYAFPAEIPEGSKKTYSRLWEPLIGLSLYSLLYDPVPLQHLKRLEYRAKRSWLILCVHSPARRPEFSDGCGSGNQGQSGRNPRQLVRCGQVTRCSM